MANHGSGSMRALLNRPSSFFSIGSGAYGELLGGFCWALKEFDAISSDGSS